MRLRSKRPAHKTGTTCVATAVIVYFLMYCPSLGASPIAYVQSNYATPQTPQALVNVPYTKAQVAGDTNIVVVGWVDATAVATSVTDTQRNVYTLVAGPTVQPDGGMSQAIYSASNIVGAAANANTVQVTFNVPANFPDIRILEYSGLNVSNPLDGTAQMVGNSAVATSGMLSTTSAYDLLFAANTVWTSNVGQPDGFVLRMITSPDADIAADKIVTVTGSYSASAPLTAPGPWVMQLVAFKGATPPPPPSQIGQWDGPFTWPIVGVHLILLRTGEVLGFDREAVTPPFATVWNPTTGTFLDVSNPFSLIFCAGNAALPDGRVLVAGGHPRDMGEVGITDVNLFNPTTRSWSLAAPMSFARWYPTVTTLPNGQVMAVGGATTCGACIADIPEMYDPTTNAWTPLPNASMVLPLYPFVFVLPDGRLLNAGASEGSTTTQVLNLNTQTWTTIDPTTLDGGSAAMYRPGKVIKSGLSATSGPPYGPAVNTTYVLDMTQPPTVWHQTAPMAFARAYHILTVLPDGSVLVTGGGQSSDVYNLDLANYEAEIWSPTTMTWTTMARMQVPRLYHSTALLLPDGRVLVAGGGHYTGGRDNDPLFDHFDAEIYSPPYLFRGPRPTITAVASTIQYGSQFPVQTPDASRIASVALVRLGAVTHAFNQDQRYVPLTFQQVVGGVIAQAPANSNLAPPGYYMLFLVDANGVPSIARFVSIQ